MKRFFCKFICSLFIVLACCGLSFAQPQCDCDAACDDPTSQTCIDCLDGCEGVPLDNKAWLLVLVGGTFAFVKLSGRRLRGIFSNSHS